MGLLMQKGRNDDFAWTAFQYWSALRVRISFWLANLFAPRFVEKMGEENLPKIRHASESWLTKK